VREIRERSATKRHKVLSDGPISVISKSDVTIDDPKAYTKPFTVRVNQRIMLDTELIEFICEDRDATHYVGAK